MVKPEARSHNFLRAIEFTLPWEVGKDRNGKLRADGALHYKDDGLPTKWGIFKGAKDKQGNLINADIDVENLTLDGALEIYRQRYWDVYKEGHPSLQLDDATLDLAVVIFDAGVNCGVDRSRYWYSQVEKAKAKDPVKAHLGFREKYYFDLKSEHKKYQVNYNGWMNRVNDLKKYVDVLRKELPQSSPAQS